MPVFPTKNRPFWQYMPLVSIACLFWWITGLGLWIHFTQTAYNKSLDVMDTLQIANGSGVTKQAKRIYDSLVATCVVYTLFAVAIHSLGIWRGFLELDQDSVGQIEEEKSRMVLYANIGLQVAWWMVLVWMIIMMGGYGAFAAFIYSIKSALKNVTALQLLFPPQGSIQGYCPVACLNTVSTGVFLFTAPDGKISGTSSICVCDPGILNDAEEAATTAYAAVPGMMVGVLLMLLYGLVLLAYLNNMLVKTSFEQDVANRMLEQGFVPVGSGNNRNH